MMAPYSQEQWLAIIDRAKQDLPSDRISYKAPNFGTVEFAKYIDHTLLKLDATEEQIDRLCDEARNYDFKVRNVYHHHVASIRSTLFITVLLDVAI